MKKSNRKNGFTMVELIVVIVIILVLAAVLVPSLLKYIRKAQEAAAIEECAGVVKMAGVERAEWLSEGGTAPANAEIVQSAGANGEIIKVTYSKEDFDVTYMMYECKSGIVVIYEYDKDPQFRIARENETTPTTIIQNWINSANDIAKEFIENGQKYGFDRQKVIEKIYKDNSGLLQVDNDILKGTKYESDMNSLYWRPYYYGSDDNLSTFLYANTNSDGTVKTWDASIIYLDGKTYEYKGDGKTMNIAGIFNCKTTDDVKLWLEDKGFGLVE